MIIAKEESLQFDGPYSSNFPTLVWFVKDILKDMDLDMNLIFVICSIHPF